MAPEAVSPSPGDSWFRRLAEATGDVFFMLRTKPDLALEFASDALGEHLGYPVQEFHDDPALFTRVVDHRDADRFALALATQPGESFAAPFRWVHRDGHPVWTQIVMSSRSREDGSVVIEGTSHDITAHTLAEQALANSEARYRLLAENAWDVIWTMALDGSITYVSPAVERVRGLTPAEAMAQRPEEIQPPESVARGAEYYRTLFTAIAEGTELPIFRGEQEYYRKDGSIMIGDLQVIPHVDAEGNALEILGVTRDVSEQKKYEAELRRLAVTDPLTGVWNRRHGTELLQADIAEANRYGPAMSLLVLDIDGFKAINDTFGHQVGDRVLIELTQRLQSSLRTTDVLARWGGEEFIVMMRQCDLEDAVQLAEKIRGLVADAPFAEAGTVTMSIGAAQLDAGEQLSSWIARADHAMYAAKAAGRNTVMAQAS